MIKTKHRYIEKYPIIQSDKYLILGTIHPHNENKKIDFFYGNENSLWNIIAEACSIVFNDVESILEFLRKHHIAISDMILECARCDASMTKDADIKPTKFNTALKEEILNSDIHTIFFTSAFGENNAAKLFFREFCLVKPKDWNETRDFYIDFFGRNLRCVILYSPSGEANRGIVKSKFYKEAFAVNKQLTVAQYRIDSYRQKFCTVIDSAYEEKILNKGVSL